MLKLSETFLKRPVLSLRSGGVIATTIRALINPKNLKIEGFYCQDPAKKELVLLYQDIRDIIPQGVVVNDHEVLTEAHELVRLKDVIKLKFELLNKPVITHSKQSLGKVIDYSAEVETMFVQKIYVEKPLLKSLSGGSLTIDRNQIIEVTKSKVIVQDLLQPTKAVAAATAPAG